MGFFLEDDKGREVYEDGLEGKDKHGLDNPYFLVGEEVENPGNCGQEVCEKKKGDCFSWGVLHIFEVEGKEDYCHGNIPDKVERYGIPD